MGQVDPINVQEGLHKEVIEIDKYENIGETFLRSQRTQSLQT